MLNHSSATPHTIKSTNNNTLSRQEAGADGRSRKQAQGPGPGGRSRKQAQGAGAGGRSRKQAQEAGAGGRCRKTTISNVLRRRAQAVIKDRSIDGESRALIRYGLETNDPLLAELVRRVEAGETIIETIVLLKHPKPKPRTRMEKRLKR